MRIILDFQEFQITWPDLEQRNQTISFVSSLLAQCHDHQIILVLSSFYPETLLPIRQIFSEFIPQDSIRIWYSPALDQSHEEERQLKRQIAEKIRNALFYSLQADIIIETALTRGYDDNAILSLCPNHTGKQVFLQFNQMNLVTLKDFFYSDPLFEDFYRQRKKFLQSSSIEWIILEHSQKQAYQVRHLSTREGFNHFNKPSPLSQKHSFMFDKEALTHNVFTDLFNLLEDKLKSIESKIYGSFNLVRTTIFRRNPKKIIVSKLDHLGDFILAIPALTKLRSRYPQAQIDIILWSGNVELASELGFFTTIYRLDCFTKQAFRDDKAFKEEVKNLLSQLGHYDIALDLRRPADTRSILTQISADLKIGYETKNKVIDLELDRALPTFYDIPFRPSPLNKKSISIQMIDIIDSIPTEPQDYIQLPQLRAYSPQISSLALFPMANNDGREWGRQNFLFLAQSLESLDSVGKINVFFTSQQEATLSGFRETHKIKLHCGLALAKVMTILSKNILCIANNAGGAHLASYLGLQVLSLYSGLETPEEFAPVFGNSWVIHHQAECSPCHITDRQSCPHDYFCLANLEVEDVFNLIQKAILSLMRNPSESSLFQLKHRQLSPQEVITQLLHSIVNLENSWKVNTEILSQSIEATLPNKKNKNLFIDVSAIVKADPKTGIQRVVRGILRALLLAPPEGFDIIPIYAEPDPNHLGYKEANRFLKNFTNQLLSPEVIDWPISFYPGDIFLGLDYHPATIPIQKDYLKNLQSSGVKIYFVLYDLLAFNQKHFFMEEHSRAFEIWLNSIALYDGVLCISSTVANDIKEFMSLYHPEKSECYEYHWFHIGANIDNSIPSKGLPPQADKVLDQIKNKKTFLMVGTIEARKGHRQVVSAFENLWQEHYDVNLVIVGQKGWLSEDFIEKIEKHNLLNKNLFVFHGISDEFLTILYKNSDCLIAASEGEGFGLPLIEAAQNGINIIARDIPIFREVAGDHVFYFDGLQPDDLSNIIKKWLTCWDNKTLPDSKNMPWKTWEESAQQLLSRIIKR